VADTGVEVNFFDPAVAECPYPTYRFLRDEAPVWRDPFTGMYVISRYDDVRPILLDNERFSNSLGGGGSRRDGVFRPDDPGRTPAHAEISERVALLQRLYEERGLARPPNLSLRDEPTHMEIRRVMEYAFRPAKLKEIEPYVGQTALELIDAFLPDGRCDWVAQFAVPLPLRVIGRQAGIPDEELPQIKRWTDAWVKRLGLMQTEPEMRRSVELEVEVRAYLADLYARLREEPADSFLSVLVNTEIPEWGRALTDDELHMVVMADVLVGGSETATNALSAGVMLLIENPQVWERLKSEPERHLATFCEEVLRLESPAQGFLREVTVDVELHGLSIPAGSIVNLRFGAANRDERAFDSPDELDIERDKPQRHLAFGTGRHHCLGAPIARRELYHGFKALLERIDELWFIEGANTFSHQRNFFLRALEELHIGFKAAA
jgi:cytochrome P450